MMKAVSHVWDRYWRFKIDAPSRRVEIDDAKSRQEKQRQQQERQRRQLDAAIAEIKANLEPHRDHT